MRFTVEPWDPAYGTAVESLDFDQTSESVDLAVEMPLDQWAPIDPAAGAAPIARPESVLFVDGVRRIDVRIWIHHDGLAKPGVCATVAAGAVRIAGSRAAVVDAVVHRGLYTDPEGTDSIATPHGTYELVGCDGSSPEDVYLAIHNRMTALEQRVSARGDADLVIVDGPLRGRSGDRMVGYVKTQHVHYLDEVRQRVLGALAAGTRTPVFLIQGRQPRYSWYLRLPGPLAHPLSGIVRCECPPVGAVADVSAKASMLASLLPRFASQPHKDSRAPQNLYPIAGLEADLRRRLGDARYLERQLRAASAIAATAG